MNDRAARFQTLVDSQPDNPLFRFSLAQALEADGRLGEAAGHYRVCVRSRADWMMPRILLGKLLLRAPEAQNPAEARSLLEDALRLAVEQDHEEPAEELRALLASL